MKDLSDIKNSDIKIVIDEYIHSERDRAVLLDRLQAVLVMCSETC